MHYAEAVEDTTISPFQGSASIPQMGDRRDAGASLSWTMPPSRPAGGDLVLARGLATSSHFGAAPSAPVDSASVAAAESAVL
jgi:hypothetical protein